MNVLDKLLERDVIVEQEHFASLTDQQLTQLDRAIDDLDDQQLQDYLQRGSVEILRSYSKKPNKRTYQDFVGHFTRRLEQIGGILRQRKELSAPTSIAHCKKDQKVAIIGVIWEKGETKNGHIMLTLEDKTGTTKVLLSKKHEHLIALGKDLQEDEVIGITGLCGDDIVFANEVYLPDIPASNELKKAPDEAYAIFLSDLHFGNKDFFYKEFVALIKWLRGEFGSETQKAIAEKVKYLFIVGDLIEGVGIYPGQEADLSIIDVKKQYEEFAKYISKLPSRLQIIMCPGNHDAGRLAEPQLNLYEDFAEDVLNMANVHLVSNPSYVKIHRSKFFEGFDVLLYHGYSFIYYGNNVGSIFQAGGVNRPELIMKYLLQRRHLAPTHTSNLYIPDPVEDPLVIHTVPDFFVSGHTHHAVHDNYKGVTMLNCSCWVPITDNQLSYGLECHPGKVPIVNLQSRQVKLMSFVKEDEHGSS